MTNYFLDASAIVKRYSQEEGSSWVISVTEPSAGNVISLAEITLVEVAAALAAKQRASPGIPQLVRERAIGQFLRDCERSFLLVQATRDIINAAVVLTGRYRLRGYDAVQLAVAVSTHVAALADGHDPLVLVTADTDLLIAARGEGLRVDNPLSHP